MVKRQSAGGRAKRLWPWRAPFCLRSSRFHFFFLPPVHFFFTQTERSIRRNSTKWRRRIRERERGGKTYSIKFKKKKKEKKEKCCIITGDASGGEPGGRSARNCDRNGRTWTVWRRCACGSGVSIHRSEQTAIGSLPKSTGRAFHLHKNKERRVSDVHCWAPFLLAPSKTTTLVIYYIVQHSEQQLPALIYIILSKKKTFKGIQVRWYTFKTDFESSI